jgi:hypothetical protein
MVFNCRSPHIPRMRALSVICRFSFPNLLSPRENLIRHLHGKLTVVVLASAWSLACFADNRISAFHTPDILGEEAYSIPFTNPSSAVLSWHRDDGSCFGPALNQYLGIHTVLLWPASNLPPV